MKPRFLHVLLMSGFIGGECAWLDSWRNSLLPWYFGTGIMGFAGQLAVMFLVRYYERHS